MIVVGIAGRAQHGKSTVAAEIVRQCNLHGKTAVVLAFADPLREFVYAQNPFVSPVWRYAEIVDMLGYEKAKSSYPEVRRILQVTGTEAAREVFGARFWIEQMARRVQIADDLSTDVVVVPDVRFENEVEYVEEEAGLLVHVARVNDKGQPWWSGVETTHPSEAYADEAAHRSTYGIVAPDVDTLEIATKEFYEGWLA